MIEDVFKAVADGELPLEALPRDVRAKLEGLIKEKREAEKMSPEALCKHVTQVGFTLLEAEFALDARPHKIENLSATRKSLIWVRDENSSLMTANPSKVGDYLSLLEHYPTIWNLRGFPRGWMEMSRSMLKS